MPAALTRHQWSQWYAADEATTADAERLGSLISLHAAQSLLAYQRQSPNLQFKSVGLEDDNHWEVFVKPPASSWGWALEVTRIFTENEHLHGASLQTRLTAGRIPLVLANAAVAANVRTTFTPSFTAVAYMAHEQLSHLGVTLKVPDQPVWTEASLEALVDRLSDQLEAMGLRGKALRQELRELADLPERAPETEVQAAGEQAVTARLRRGRRS